MSIAANLKNLLHIKGMKAIDLADKTGLRPSVISDIATGKTKNPRFDTLRTLAQGLDADISELTEGVSGEKKEELAPEPRPVLPDGFYWEQCTKDELALLQFARQHSDLTLWEVVEGIRQAVKQKEKVEAHSEKPDTSEG